MQNVNFETTSLRLRQALTLADLKPQDLADKSGVSKSSISQYINGSHAPSISSSKRMAAVLNVSELWLMGFDVPMKNTGNDVSALDSAKPKLEKLYSNIKLRRKQLQLTQSELAFKVGYTDKSIIAKIETGNVDISLSKIILFANALHTTPLDLIGWETDACPELPISQFSRIEEPAYCEESFNSVFSKKLKHYLNKFDMSQNELAKHLGVGTTSVYNWYNGLKTPRMDKVDATCSIFGCKRSDLINDGEICKSNLADRIRERRKAVHLTQEELAAKLGLQKSAIAKYENGRVENIKKSTLLDMSRILGCAPNYLIGWDDRNDSDNILTVKIPVFKRIVAEFATDSLDDIVDWDVIPETLAATGDYFGLIINDSSMEPRIYNGDMVVVRKQSNVESGSIAIVSINGADAVCRRLIKYRNSIGLTSNEPRHKSMIFAEQEIESQAVKIIGKVVELRGKL